MRIPVLSSLIHYFRVFRRYAGSKLYVLCLVILASGLLEGLGVSLLLPILNYQQSPGAADAYSKIVYGLLEKAGIDVSLVSLLILMILAFALKGLFMFLQTAIKSRIVTDLTRDQRLLLCEKYARMNYDYYTNSQIGYLNNIITTEISGAVAGFGNYIDVIVAAIYIVVYTAAAAILDWKTTALVFTTCLILFVLLRRLSRLASELSIGISRKNAQIQSLLIPMIYNFKYLKATANFPALYQQLKQRIEDHRLFQFKNNIITGLPSAIVEPLTVVFLAGLIWYKTVLRGQAISEIFVLLLFFYRAFSRTFGFQVVWQKFCGVIGGVDAVEKINRELDINEEKTGSRVINDFQQQLVFKDVSFAYQSKPVLTRVNMVIPKNKTIGIVGESGAGKTTIFDLLAGLLKPRSGTLNIDGTLYTDIDLTSLRKTLGYVIQEPVIFNDTVANNISFWQGDYNTDPDIRRRIEDSARRAHCVEFIQGTANGFNTILGDKGVKLSVGQRQRIAIARELFKQPQIIIFDEATSALDTESERLIQQSIQEMAGTMTMVIVAHRLSTIKHCDYIYVLSKGQIIEEGRFEELYNRESSSFRRMCNLQNV